VADPDIFVPIWDASTNEYSPWHDVVWTGADGYLPVVSESNYGQHMFFPGLTSMMACSTKYVNVAAQGSEAVHPTPGVHRSHHPSAGSFTYYHNSAYTLLKPVRAGEELVVACPPPDSAATTGTGSITNPSSQKGHGAAPAATTMPSSGRKVLNLDFLKETSVCLEGSLSTRTSDIPGAGRGAFATRPYQKGDVVLASPVVHLDRSQLEIVEQREYPDDHWTPYRRSHNVLYNATNVTSYQLLTNYVYGDASEGSNVVLLPLGPHANLINHGGSAKSNVHVRWSNQPHLKGSRMKNRRPTELLSTPVGGGPSGDLRRDVLVLEYVATRTIGTGDEILLDYGDDWDAAWRQHVAQFHRPPESTFVMYRSAAQYLEEERQRQQQQQQLDDDSTIVYRTLSEQEEDPYPDNLQTACYFALPSSYDEAEYNNNDEDDDDESGIQLTWSDECASECLRPCDIVDRKDASDEEQEDEDDEEEDSEDHGPTYTVVVYDIDNYGPSPGPCGGGYYDIPVDGITVMGVPSDMITIQDRPYTTDMHLPTAFRHEIGLPRHLLPPAWSRHDPAPHGDFVRQGGKALAPGTLERVRWKDTGEAVTPWAFRVGMDPRVRQVLLEYCNRKGITDALRHVTVEGNGFHPGQEAKMLLDGQEWFLQRPGKKWHSNLHWLSPNGMAAHDDYLQALQWAGFDDVLKSIGEALQMDGLVAFHVTFIGVSQAIRGYVHIDVSQTEAKTYNVIIPLILANDTGPELDLQAFGVEGSDRDDIGRYRYVYDEAAMMGDDAYHATSAVDYRRSKEMRLAATVYIADVNERNVDRIMEEYTQAFPPRDSALLMSWAGRHWHPNDPTRGLPKPTKDHILLRNDNDGGRIGRNASLVEAAMAEKVDDGSATPAVLEKERIQEIRSEL
jgi:hypothetical protein